MRVALYPFLLFFAAGLLAPGARADPVALPPHRSVILESERMGEARAINLYLPPDHGGDRRYPVVYMPDGGLDEDFPHVAGAIDAAIREGRMAPVILVGIANTQRRRDMTGPTEVEEDRAIAPVVGGSPAFRAFIASELVPWVEANLPAGEGRAIIGESLAGLFILETLFEQPDLFDTPGSCWTRACGGTQDGWRGMRQAGSMRTPVSQAGCIWPGRNRIPSARMSCVWRNPCVGLHRQACSGGSKPGRISTTARSTARWHRSCCR